MTSAKKEAIKTKVEKEFPDFVDMISSAEIASLEKNLYIYAKHREETELAKVEDEELQMAKERVKDLSAPYSDAIKALKLKMAYINLLIEEKGQPSSADQEG